MANIYLIAVKNDDSFNVKEFHKFVKEKLYPEHVGGWWHYVSGPTYLVKSETLDAKGISEIITQFTGKQSHLVTKIDLEDIEGMLPARAWDWLGLY